jgi:hypothetical protein
MQSAQDGKILRWERLMSEWLPIETAPKDGTTILAWSKYLLEPVTAAWRRNAWMASWEKGAVIEYQGDYGTEYKDASPLTHWQPLPTPPEVEP